MTVGGHAFPVADACMWNDLPWDITSSPSLLTFTQQLKMHLFCHSYPRSYLLTVRPLCSHWSSCLLLRSL